MRFILLSLGASLVIKIIDDATKSAHYRCPRCGKDLIKDKIHVRIVIYPSVGKYISGYHALCRLSIPEYPAIAAIKEVYLVPYV
jgi:hypothetical protein